jgi:hypothetical protein
LSGKLGLIAVPCPFFLPKEPLRETGWAVPPRAPLGVLCAGECHANGTPRPADHELCNFGYARGICERFPPDAEVDAVRFQVTARDIEVAYVRYFCERDHSPTAHGTLIYNVETRELQGAEPHSPLALQAIALLTY